MKKKTNSKMNDFIIIDSNIDDDIRFVSSLIYQHKFKRRSVANELMILYDRLNYLRSLISDYEEKHI